MKPRNDEPIDGLEAVQRAWRDLGEEAPPDLVDQAVLNRARLAAEKPRRVWTFNLTWVHGLATMGVAALALTLFLQLRLEVPGASSPSAFEVSRRAATDEPKDADAAEHAAGEQQQVLARKAIAEPASAPPPVPMREKARSLSDAPDNQAPGDMGSNTLEKAVPEGAEFDARQAPEPNPRDHNEVSRRSQDESAHATRLDAEAESVSSGKAAANASAIDESQPLTDALLEAPLYPSLAKLQESAWPEDPDALSELECPLAGAPAESDTATKTDCASRSFADVLFQQMRHLKQRGESERYQRLLDMFRAHYPDYPLPADLAE